MKTLLSAMVLAVVLMSGPLASSAQGDLSLIAPGLTAEGLCPLVDSKPQVAIDAIAAGTNKAYTQGSSAQEAYAAALGAAVGAAAGNGCIDAVFEIVNQAIIKGGLPTEYVVGKALAMGTAQGVDSETGQVLAKATAVVMCRGGESASACAKAWNQAIKIDSNGCAVLVRAFAQAKASCGPGYATSQTSATVFREPLGVCGADEFMQTARGGSAVAQGSDGQVVKKVGPITIVKQGSSGKGVSKTVTLPFHKFVVTKTFGRRMLAVQVPAEAVTTVEGGSIGRGLQQWWKSKAVSNAAAVNSGWTDGPVVANSYAEPTPGAMKSKAVANSYAENSGYAAGGVFANSVAMGKRR